MTEIAENISSSEICKLNNEVFEEIIGVSVNCVVDPRKEQDILSKMEEFASKSNVEASVVKTLVKQLMEIISVGVNQNLSNSHIRLQLEKLGVSSEKISVFFDKWDDNRFEVSKHFLTQTVAHNRLVDMEWKFGVSAASSECNKIGSTFLQLKLIIKKGEELENVHMELSLPQFYSFMHEMERAKASMELYT